LFRFGPEPILLDKKEMFSFVGADSGTNSDVMVSFLLDVGTFVEHLCLFLYCFDITNPYTKRGGGSYFMYDQHGSDLCTHVQTSH
jgi:hypothetical protein